MITIGQIKAARALLNWNQELLAEYAGLSKPAIANIERGKVLPRTETLQAITKALVDGGVEFTDGPGVRLRGETLQIQVFEGENAIFRLWQDMLNTLKDGDIRMLSGTDERTYDKIAGKEKFRDFMRKFAERRITSRLLVRHGDTYFVEPISHYRWISNELFSQVPYFVYADKYAILITEPIQRVVLIENKAIADSYRKQFMGLWDNATIPTL